MLTYHGSSLLPGATGYIRDDAERAAFLVRLEGYFGFSMGECRGEMRSVNALPGALSLYA